jgi:hypothetical protein
MQKRKASTTMQIASSGVTRIRLEKNDYAHAYFPPHSPPVLTFNLSGKMMQLMCSPSRYRQIAYFGAREQAGIVIAACFCTLSATKVALKQINSVRPAYTVYRARLSTLACSLARSHPRS